jgi:DNA ligase (NAD+)
MQRGVRLINFWQEDKMVDLFDTPKAVVDLTEKEAVHELAVLAFHINANDIYYYEKDAPTISDAAYDALRLRNNEIEQRFPHLIRSDSPSKRVGAKPSGKFGKIKHSVPMLSLDNAFNDDDVREFVKRIQRFLGLDAADNVALTAEPKIDGLSLCLRYEKGELLSGDARGRHNG